MDARRTQISQRNVVACDNFVREISPPAVKTSFETSHAAAPLARAVSKVVKLWTSPSGFVRGKALSKGTGIGLIDFDSYSFGRSFKIGPLSLAAQDPQELKVGDCLFGLVHQVKTASSARPLRRYARCTRSNGLLSVIEGIYSRRFCPEMYSSIAPEFGICLSLLLGRYRYALEARKKIGDIRRFVLELSLFCGSGRIWRQFCNCYEEYIKDSSGDEHDSICDVHHIENRSIMAFIEQERNKVQSIDAVLRKPLAGKVRVK